MATKMVAQAYMHGSTSCADCLVERLWQLADIRYYACVPIHQCNQIQAKKHQQTIHSNVCLLLQMAILLANPDSLKDGIRELSCAALTRFALCPSANYVLQRIIRQRARTGHDLSNIIHAMCLNAAFLACHNIAYRILLRLLETCTSQELDNLFYHLLPYTTFVLSTEKYEPFSIAICDELMCTPSYEATVQKYLNSEATVWGPDKQYATFGGVVLTELVKNHPETAMTVLQGLDVREAQHAQISYVWQAVVECNPCDAVEKLRYWLGQADLENLMTTPSWGPWLRKCRRKKCHSKGLIDIEKLIFKEGGAPSRSRA